MKTLTEVLKERLQAEIQVREHLQRKAALEQAERRQKEEMAAEDARILIQRSAGFTVDGWTVKADFAATTEEGEDLFTISLVRESGHRNWLHRVNFNGYLAVNGQGQARFEVAKMTAVHAVNPGGDCRSKKDLTDLLEALVFAQYGEIFGLGDTDFFGRAGDLLERLEGEG